LLGRKQGVSPVCVLNFTMVMRLSALRLLLSRFFPQNVQRAELFRRVAVRIINRRRMKLKGDDFHYVDSSGKRVGNRGKHRRKRSSLLHFSGDARRGSVLVTRLASSAAGRRAN